MALGLLGVDRSKHRNPEQRGRKKECGGFFPALLSLFADAEMPRRAGAGGADASPAHTARREAERRIRPRFY